MKLGRNLLFALLVISTIRPANALDGDLSLCEKATRMDVNTTLHTHSNGFDVFELDVPFTGLLTLDVAVPVDASIEPKVAFFGRHCRKPISVPNGLRVIERFVTSLVLEVEAPGNYRFGIAAQDPRLALEEYQLSTSFMSDEETEEELCLEKVEEPEPDPDLVEEPEPDPDLAVDPWSCTLRQLEVCRESNDLDDHGDTFFCATTLNPDLRVAGELGNGWGNDSDLFTFVLTEQETVRIQTGGRTDTLGGLYDSQGHRLAADDDGGRGSGFRLVKTLGPGRYYVRVEGRHRAEGAYSLSLRTLSW